MESIIMLKNKQKNNKVDAVTDIAGHNIFVNQLAIKYVSLKLQVISIYDDGVIAVYDVAQGTKVAAYTFAAKELLQVLICEKQDKIFVRTNEQPQDDKEQLSSVTKAFSAGLGKLSSMSKRIFMNGSKSQVFVMDLKPDLAMKKYIFYRFLEDGKKQIGEQLNFILSFKDTNLCTELIKYADLDSLMYSFKILPQCQIHHQDVFDHEGFLKLLKQNNSIIDYLDIDADNKVPALFQLFYSIN